MFQSIYNTKFGNPGLVLIICILALTACNPQELPTVESSGPVFYFSGSAGNEAVNLEAGKDDYYMYTSTQNSTSGNVWEGHLKKRNCDGCGPALKIAFHPEDGSNLSAGNQSWQYQALQQENWKTRQFRARPTSGGDQTFEWSFGDSSTSTEREPVHTYQSPGTYEVCLTTTGTTDCRSTICNNIIIGSDNCNASFQMEHNGQKTISYEALKGGYSQYEWDFGDGNSAPGQSTQHTYTYAGFYEVCLTVADGAGCQTTFCREISASETNSCLSGYIHGPAFDTISAGTGVVIEWTTANGEIYTSNALGKTHASDAFSIETIEEYKPNNEGKPTKALTMTFDGFLFKEDDPQDSIRIVTDSVSKFAVAYDDN